MGAGTSGRLAVLEAAECPPTFNTSPVQIRAQIDGGPRSMFRAMEGAEDSLARRRGASTLLVTSNGKPHGVKADIVIAPDVGPEVVTGSTRLKSGTAAKLVLNALTTGAMIRIGKVHDHWMVDLKPTSRKLRLRGERITADLGRVSPARARSLFRAAGGASSSPWSWPAGVCPRARPGRSWPTAAARCGGRYSKILDLNQRGAARRDRRR